MLDNKLNQSSKFKTKNWVKIDNESPGTPDKDNEIRFKTLMLVQFYVIMAMDIYLLKEL